MLTGRLGVGVRQAGLRDRRVDCTVGVGQVPGVWVAGGVVRRQR